MSIDVLKLSKSSVTVTVALEVPSRSKLTPGMTSDTVLLARLIEPIPLTERTAFWAVDKMFELVEKPRSGVELSVN